MPASVAFWAWTRTSATTSFPKRTGTGAGRRLIADRFRDRNAFIAGDAAHIWVPYAGSGMNAGIADAMNLSWLLAGHLNGWAPASILDAYEAERWPITNQVSRFAMSHAEAENSPPQRDTR